MTELKERRERALEMGECAILRCPEAYLELKRLLRRITSESLDVGSYYRSACQMSDLLKQLASEDDPCLFRHFYLQIDPRRQGLAQFFRPECQELQEFTQDLDAWRAERRNIRCVP